MEVAEEDMTAIPLQVIRYDLHHVGGVASLIINNPSAIKINHRSNQLTPRRFKGQMKYLDFRLIFKKTGVLSSQKLTIVKDFPQRKLNLEYFRQLIL